MTEIGKILFLLRAAKRHEISSKFHRGHLRDMQNYHINIAKMITREIVLSTEAMFRYGTLASIRVRVTIGVTMTLLR